MLKLKSAEDMNTGNGGCWSTCLPGGGDDQVDPKSKFARHMDTGNVMNVD
jgi:hypothetical protein